MCLFLVLHILSFSLQEMERIEQKLDKVFEILDSKDKEIKKMKLLCHALYDQLVKFKRRLDILEKCK